jgi:hypothetical protein
VAAAAVVTATVRLTFAVEFSASVTQAVNVKLPAAVADPVAPRPG